MGNHNGDGVGFFTMKNLSCHGPGMEGETTTCPSSRTLLCLTETTRWIVHRVDDPKKYCIPIPLCFIENVNATARYRDNVNAPFPDPVNQMGIGDILQRGESRPSRFRILLDVSPSSNLICTDSIWSAVWTEDMTYFVP